MSVTGSGGTGLGAFLAGAFRNRRYTRSASSFVLAGAVSAPPLLTMALAAFVPDRTLSILPGMLWLLGNVLLFPLARELYYRITWPLRSAARLWLFPLPFVAVICFGRVVVFGVLLLLAVPLGLVGLGYLGAEDRRGVGHRFV